MSRRLEGVFRTGSFRARASASSKQARGSRRAKRPHVRTTPTRVVAIRLGHSAEQNAPHHRVVSLHAEPDESAGEVITHERGKLRRLRLPVSRIPIPRTGHAAEQGERTERALTRLQIRSTESIDERGDERGIAIRNVRTQLGCGVGAERRVRRIGEHNKLRKLTPTLRKRANGRVPLGHPLAVDLHQIAPAGESTPLNPTILKQNPAEREAREFMVRIDLEERLRSQAGSLFQAILPREHEQLGVPIETLLLPAPVSRRRGAPPVRVSLLFCTGSVLRTGALHLCVETLSWARTEFDAVDRLPRITDGRSVAETYDDLTRTALRRDLADELPPCFQINLVRRELRRRRHADDDSEGDGPDWPPIGDWPPRGDWPPPGSGSSREGSRL